MKQSDCADTDDVRTQLWGSPNVAECFWSAEDMACLLPLCQGAGPRESGKYRHFVYDENQRYIYPTSDWGFKRLFGTEINKNLLLGVLRRLLPELNIESIEYLPRDITIPVGKMKDASFDVLCRMHNGGIAVIEMQNYARKAFLDRALVYSSAAVLEHYVNSSERNYRIGKTIFLAFVGDPVFHEVNRTPIRLSLCDIEEVSTVIRNDKLLQIFVELPKFAGSLEQIDENTPFVEKLAYVLMEMADCQVMPDNLSDPLLEDIFKAADKSRMSMEEQDNYMKAIIGEADYEYHMDGAREQGFDEGRQEGREEASVAMVKKLKAEGISLEVIAKCSGLEMDAIKTL